MDKTGYADEGTLAYIEQLQTELEAAKATQARYVAEREEILIELNKEQDSGTELRQQLAARDLVIQEMREAISENHEWHKIYDIYDGYIESDLASTNSRALALQPSTEALDAYVAEAVAARSKE